MSTGDLLHGFLPVARIIPVDVQTIVVFVFLFVVLVVIVGRRPPSRQVVVDEALVVQLGVQGRTQRHSGSHLPAQTARYAAGTPLGPLGHLALGVEIGTDHRLRNVPGALLAARRRLLQLRRIRHPFALLPGSLLLVLPGSRFVALAARGTALTPRAPLGHLALRIALVQRVQLLAGLVVAIPFRSNARSSLEQLLLAIGLLGFYRILEYPSTGLASLSAPGTTLGPLVPRFRFADLFGLVFFVFRFTVLLV